jgi:hypothetical protein
MARSHVVDGGNVFQVLTVKGEVTEGLQLTKHHAMKMWERAEVHFHNSQPRHYMISFTLLPLYPWGHNPGNAFLRGWVGPRTCVGIVGKGKGKIVPVLN